MRILAAYTNPIAFEPGDFSFTKDGEIVVRQIVCCKADSCGCDRSLVGLETRKGTTLIQVIETNLSPAMIIKEIVLSQERAYSVKFPRAEAIREFNFNRQHARQYKTGTVLRVGPGPGFSPVETGSS